MEDKIKYLVKKLASGLFNVKHICKATQISHPTVSKIADGNGINVRLYIIDTLYDYFKKIGD